jgi:hypothetical protein
MVSQRDLEQVVTQVNSSYASLMLRLTKVEAMIANIKTTHNIPKKESKEKA